MHRIFNFLCLAIFLQNQLQLEAETSVFALKIEPPERMDQFNTKLQYKRIHRWCMIDEHRKTDCDGFIEYHLRCDNDSKGYSCLDWFCACRFCTREYRNIDIVINKQSQIC
ncbi:hypothetical protein WR25_09295 [Diploscapter pachys]|uniref:Uncharacterized protein n=1 Tax=Diploscapter pachys TaxID=2018661 RepID=A0A2A2L0W6_9BILA|nr:hypothetical protein WR25_09295 [Diploscapter pachys]